MLAPEPFFEPRGTPFSEYHRIKALGELGHDIDLVTYPFGADVDLPRLRIIRCARPPFLRSVRIGPSAAKLALDVCLGLTALRLAMRQRYDVVHSHEEAGLLGVWLARRLRIPHLYDMHSSLPQQLSNFGYSRSRVLRRVFEQAEQRMVIGSDVVITICQELQDAVSRMGAGDRAILIENVMGGEVDGQAGPGRVALRRTWSIDAGAPLVLYTGTFEPYQGLEMLAQAGGLLRATHPEAQILVVGGEPDQVTATRQVAVRHGAPMVFTGRRPPEEIPWFIEACDILVSPRIAGTNTPLKIYSYLRSGRPIVATDLRTHTQVLSPEVAILVPPRPESFAAALARLIDLPEERMALAGRAAAAAAMHYSRAAYVTRTAEAYRRLQPSLQPEAAEARSGLDDRRVSPSRLKPGPKVP